MFGDQKSESDQTGHRPGWVTYFFDNGDNISDQDLDDMSRTATKAPLGVTFLRRRYRWTYVHVAIHFLCLVYWMTQSSTCNSVLSTWSSGGSSNVDSSKGPSNPTSAVPPPSSLEANNTSNTATLNATTGRYPSLFPRHVWQTASEDGRQHWAKYSRTWQNLDGWQYNFLSDDDADIYVHTHFGKTSPAVVHFWDSLTIPVLKADFLRYLIMLASGGIYSDIDTDVLMPPDQWISSKYTEQQVNAVVGIEYDDTTYPLFVRPISFSQWTLMSKPGHPIFETAVQRLMSNLEFMARRSNKEISDFVPSKADILQGTGPCMITDVVMQAIRDQGYNIEWGTFHNQKEPVLYGDILVLPINAFAGSQKHSNSGRPEYGQKFVGHHFGRSWYQKGKETSSG